jgi:hypothetical protein
MEFWQTLLVSCIPAIVTGLVTFFVASRNAKTQIDVVKKQNEHELAKLMEQHKIDIDSLKEKHRLELEASEKDHQHKLEIIQKEHENELIRKESELENSAKYGAMGPVFEKVINKALDAPEIQGQINQMMRESFKKKGG